MSNTKALNSFLMDKTKKMDALIRVKEEVVSPKQNTPLAMPHVSPAKLKIPAATTAVAKKRKNTVQSPIGSECSTTSSSSSSSAKKRKASAADMFDMNDMGSAEEKIKEMERQLLSLDPDSKEAKKKRRLIRNRMSAQLHRERKKAYVVQLEEQLQAKDDEMQALKAQLEAMKTENMRLKNNDTPVIKTEEPAATISAIKPVETMVVEAAFDADALIYDLECEPEHWDSSILNDLDSDMLDFPEPAAEVPTPAPTTPAPRKTAEIHDSFVAKKNLAMMMAIVFSMTFFGGMLSIFDTISSGSASGFCSYFKSYSPKLLGDMNVKSRILSDLEGTTWMDFPEMNDEPTQDKSSNSDHNQYSHGIPMDDLFDDISMSFAMPLDDEEEEEDEDMTSDTGSTSDEDGGSDSNYDKSKPAKLALTKKDVSYANLTRMWCEKRHVLCTLSSAGEELKRAVVDLSHVNDTVAMESSFAEVLASFTMGDEDPKLLGANEKQVLSFLYPMGVFSKDSVDMEVLEPLPFMEVACHI
ncbi:Aste57867_12106 [Aphanomyces stellatus]|uniref:Aste57867_12106 protein n=1 Tax=Aphanomyces stellatus TaxID=120398 RepID=A0A485KUN0_9STRA|nr:hypothetical protein As57867_012061 [Aphanomyces stellatus]VFT88960.1 Aste57867_12106 [Aphanomyces stellatus]